MKYLSAVIQVISLDAEDVIATSGATKPEKDFEDENVDQEGWL